MKKINYFDSQNGPSGLVSDFFDHAISTTTKHTETFKVVGFNDKRIISNFDICSWIQITWNLGRPF